MDQLIKLLPDEKSVTCLDDLLSFKVSELEKILCSYNEKVSGNKTDPVLRTYAVFSRAKEGSSAALSRCMDSSICKYHEMYYLECGHYPWVLTYEVLHHLLSSNYMIIWFLVLRGTSISSLANWLQEDKIF